MIQNWIFSQNFKPFVETVARYAGYEFSEDEWRALTFGIRDTDSERDEWYSYDLVAAESVSLSFARDPGTSVLFVRVRSEPGLEARIDDLIHICQCYRMTN